MRTDNPTPGALVWPNPFAFAHATAYLAVMPMKDMPDLENLSLADVATLLSQQKLPPVELWHPQHCGDSGMRIAADGTWYHEGSPIGQIGRAPSELQSLMRNSYAVFCLKKKKKSHTKANGQ